MTSWEYKYIVLPLKHWNSVSLTSSAATVALPAECVGKEMRVFEVSERDQLEISRSVLFMFYDLIPH